MKRILMKKSFIIFMWCLISVSVFGGVVKAETKLKIPDSVRVYRYSDTKLRVSWKRVKGAEGYIIYKYDKASRNYKRYKTIKGKNAIQFIDKVGKNNSAKYKVSAYRKVKNKKLIGQQSDYVEARTYKQGEKKVNAGKVEVRIKGKAYEKVGGDFFAYHEKIKLISKVKPSKYSKTSGKKPLNKKLRWYSSNPQIAMVDQKGEVTVQTKKGRCYIYARAHNGKKSNRICINAENYAKPGRNAIDIDDAWNNQSRYGVVVEMFENYYELTTDIAEYFYVNRLIGHQTFRSWVGNDGEVKISLEDYLTSEIKKKIYDFEEKIPFNIEIYATSNYIKFTEYIGDGEERTTGAMITFTYDRKRKDPTSYNQKYEIAEHWIYGNPIKKI